MSTSTPSFLSDARGIFLGIGNIGPEYEHTRHNVGFDAADLLASRHASPWIPFGHSVIAGISLPEGGSLVLCKPQTYVNRSGDAALELLTATGLPSGKLLVAVDDLNLAEGALRIRSDGSAGGHNGLKSIIAAIGAEFPRIRIGIGAPDIGVSIIDFVLGRFTKEQRDLVEPAIVAAADAAPCFFTQDLETCMNRYNRTVVPTVDNNQTVLPSPLKGEGQQTTGGTHEA